MPHFAMRFLPDIPILEPEGAEQNDILGLREFAELVRSAVYSAESPFVFGVLGDWGTGKTSVLRMVQQRMEEDLKAAQLPETLTPSRLNVPIWFNAWKYENEANLIYPLLHTIRRDYDRRMPAEAAKKAFRDRFGKVVRVSTLALTDLGLRALTHGIAGSSMTLDDLEKHWKRVQENPEQFQQVLNQWADNVDELEGAFRDLLTQYAEELALVLKYPLPDQLRFVILIDDLDRCLPETTIAILESIKNHLTRSCCLFVFGLNARVVYQSVRAKYQGGEVDGRQYLEKFLNYTFYMPEPDMGRVKSFAASRIVNLVSNPEQLERYKNYFNTFGEILEKCRFNNPRKIKRILNRFLLFLAKYDREQPPALENFPMSNIGRLIAMAEYFPELFQLLLAEEKTAERARMALQGIGTEAFSPESFELQFGVRVLAVLPQLILMRDLFDLDERGDDQRAGLPDQVQAVYSITRLL